MLTNWRRERFIRGVLRKLSRQRVGLILQPGNVWVVERAVGGEKGVEEALRTCHMRGWTEPLTDSIPKGALTPEGTLPPPDKLFSGHGPIYRLTDAGWNVIHRTHEWVVVTCIASLIALFATVFGLAVSLGSK
jgi:hypothetical protein